MKTEKRSSFLEFALLFLLLYIGTQLAFRTFFPDQFGQQQGAQSVTLRAQDASVKGGHHPVLTLQNRSDQDLVLPDRCPMAPVEVFSIRNAGEPVEELRGLTASETAVPCVPVTRVGAHGEATIDLAAWKYSLFDAPGTYEVRLPEGATLGSSPVASLSDEQIQRTARFDIYEAGVITQIFRTFVTKPLLNLLIFIASLLPGYSLGWAIILLTLLVKIALFFPTQHALEGQKKLQAVQPKLDALREKYKGDHERLQQETLKIWREHKINPLQSCLPMLIQFPVLIGLFYVIRDGSHLALSRHLLYVSHEHLQWTFGTDFLGLDLLQPSVYLMPPLLVILQFLQMKLSFAISNRKKTQKEKGIEVSPGGKPVKKEVSSQEIQQRLMLYGLPFMIGFFALQFPAAVSLYWGVSTVFAIGQQIVVNRKDL